MLKTERSCARSPVPTKVQPPVFCGALASSSSDASAIVASSSFTMSASRSGDAEPFAPRFGDLIGTNRHAGAHEPTKLGILAIVLQVASFHRISRALFATIDEANSVPLFIAKLMGRSASRDLLTQPRGVFCEL